MTDEEMRKIEITVAKCRKCGRPQKRDEWFAVIGMMISQTDEAITEYSRQGRVYGIDWPVRVCEALLTEKAKGNTYRDQSGNLRLIDKQTELAKILSN